MEKEEKKIKVLYIATVARKRNRLDGETIKCKLLEEYLKKQDGIILKSVDTDNWKKHIIKLFFLIIYGYIWCDKIVLSSADRGARIVLDFFYTIKNKKPIYYFVIGGSLYRNIYQKKWKTDIYKKLTHIYVEASILKENLKSLEIYNVTVLNNFRKVENYDNKYIESRFFRFVYYGRVIKEKGIEEACKLIKRLNEEDIECSLDIYGQCDLEYLEHLKKMFTGSICYHGEIKPNNRIEYEILSQYDAFLFPTEYPGECLPGALIDCYISGLAILASNWEYAEEYIENGKNGYIFEYKNYEDMYVKAKELVNYADLIKLKKYSKKSSEKYMIDNVLKDFRNELSK